MDQKQALVDRLKEANNILVTVSNNPSVDQLASCIGLTLALNKLNKHATAVFSGAVPDTLEFLQPEKTIEKNTDSLRDFIIALDKSKADKLRYKVEDKVVKIFITPYRTSITDKDLEFSQGDFNVDAVVAIGVHNQGDLDQAITAHGRILHDATVTTINVNAGGQFGAINWLDTKASSLSELVAELVTDLDHEILDEQMATAMLTGIVAETKRFSNDKTSPTTMTISAELMAAGANQQLVATKLEPPKPPTPPPAPLHERQGEESPKTAAQAPPPPPKPDDGTLEISHDPSEAREEVSSEENAKEDKEEAKEPDIAQIHIDDQGSLRIGDNLSELPRHEANTDPTKHMSQHMILEPPTMGGELNGNAKPEDEEERPAGDPMGIAPAPTGILQRSEPFSGPAPVPSAPFAPSAPAPAISSAPFAPQPEDENPYPSPFSPPPQPAPSPAGPASPQPVVVTPTVVSPAPAPSPAPEPPPQPVISAPDIPPALATPASPAAPAPGQTLSEIEQNVHSPHAQAYAPEPPPADIDNARDAVMQAIASQPGSNPAPIEALNAQPLGDPLHNSGEGTPAPSAPNAPAGPSGSTAPPPLPPPMIPPAQ